MPAREASPLTIRLFGPFEVLRCGEPLPGVRTRRGHWLLALLVLRAGREVERSWLAGILWPNSPSPQAFSSLRSTLAELRYALGPDGGRLHSPTPKTLCIELSNLDVDVLAFDAAIARGDIGSLERAVALYRGPLLEGVVAEWVYEERHARQQAYLQALESLAARAVAAGERDLAEGHLRRAVAADPLRESAPRALMRLLGHGGNYAAAFQVYQELRLRLHRELSVEPDPKTSALFQQIRAEARRRASAQLASAVRSPSPSRLSAPPAAGMPPARRHNLPIEPTRLIGREMELAAARALLQREDVRLVTFTGPGGSGKTCLALAVAAELLGSFPDGVFQVSLAPIRDPRLVASSIAQTLGVRETGSRSFLESLKESLQEKSVLLLLDNFEQLLPAAPCLAELLASCSRMKLLVTSRARLRLRGERQFPVPPLALPDRHGLASLEGLAHSPAVALFLQRAQEVSPDFALTRENPPAVAEICHRLDGLPLAIELAAAWIRLLPPQALLARLAGAPLADGGTPGLRGAGSREGRPSGSPLQLLTGGARDLPDRQQTLRGTIGWSYDLLDEGEKTLFRQLSVFVGGCTLAAAEAVFAAGHDLEIDLLEGVASLVDKNLLLQEAVADGEPRLGMLETIREYGRERLAASGEAAAIQRQHASFFLALAEQAAPARGPYGPELTQWLDRLQRDHDNLRAALDWLLEAGASPSGRPEAEAALRLAGALWRFWGRRGYWSEGRERLIRALACSGANAPTAARARALVAAGGLTLLQGDPRAARALYEESLAIAREVGDTWALALSLNNTGLIARDQGDYAAARRLFEEALSVNRETEDRALQAANLGNLGDIAMATGDYARARTLYEEADAIDREFGDRPGDGDAFGNLGRVALKQGDYETARRIFETVMERAGETKDKASMAHALKNLGDLANQEGSYEAAWSFHEGSLRIRRELGYRRGMIYSLEALAALAAAQGEAVRAAQLFGAAEAQRAAMGTPLEPADRANYERDVAATRTALGEEAFAAEWEAGRAMSLDQAVRVALEEEEIPTTGRQGS